MTSYLRGPTYSSLAYYKPMAERIPISNDAPPWALIVHSAITRVKTVGQADTMKVFLPYCLHPVTNPKITPKGAHIVVNRNYSAVGCSNEWTDYETATAWHLPFERFEELRDAGVVNAHGYLYNDDAAPRRSRKLLLEYINKVLVILEPWIVAESEKRNAEKRNAQAHGVKAGA
jgi:hypothetical protein